jgi:hypothetical protein
MKRHSFYYLILWVCFGLSGCVLAPSSHIEKSAKNFSPYEECPKFDYTPLQVIAVNNDLNRSFGSGFYIENPFGKHILITNAHVVQKRFNRYNKRVKVYDQNGKHASAKVIAIRHTSRISKVPDTKNAYKISKMADIAILEIDSIPQGFRITPLKLSRSKQEAFAYSKGLDFYDSVWEGCFGMAYKDKHLYLYSDNTKALYSFSGTPVLGKNREVLGMITTTGDILVKKKNTPLFVHKPEKGHILITSQPTYSYKLFAILTSTDEIRILLNETYRTNVF